MKASRLISLLMLLQTHGKLTARELAGRLEVSPRTIYRDIDELSAAGVPVYAERGPGGGCALLDDYRTSLTGLNEDEVHALFMSTIPALLADLGADKSSESAFLKLTAALPAPFQKAAQRTRQLIYLDPAGWFHWDEPTPFLPLVQEAVWTERRLRLLYRTAEGTWSRRLIDPYGLVAKGGIWYVVGAAQGRVWTYRVSRIEEAHPTNTIFNRPADFDLAAFWTERSAAFEEGNRNFPVTLRVPPTGLPLLQAVFGEGIHHLAARHGRLDAGGNLTLEIRFGSADDACRRLLGVADQIEIVAPVALRRQLRQAALGVATRYANGS